MAYTNTNVFVYGVEKVIKRIGKTMIDSRFSLSLINDLYQYSQVLMKTGMENVNKRELTVDKRECK